MTATRESRPTKEYPKGQEVYSLTFAGRRRHPTTRSVADRSGCGPFWRTEEGDASSGTLRLPRL